MLRLLAMMALALSPIAGLAETKMNKDWMWNLDGSDGVYAATANRDGRILGQYCYFDNNTCIYTVSFGITCEKDSKYPVLVNSDTGAINVEMVCGHKMGGEVDENAFYITPFDAIDNTVRNATNIGFAVAMESGRFKVVRFSLAGSTYAIETMRTFADKKASAPSDSGNSSTTVSEQYL